MSTPITFWNHACIEITLGEGTLLCDPWLSGRVFNDSWELLEETDLAALVLGRIRYIWISQDQPDHLHLPTLRQIRANTRQPIIVFYRASPDPTVMSAIRALGFEVRALESGKTLRLDAHSEITCHATRAGSVLVARCGAEVIVNQNDCELTRRQAARIARRHGPVDVWWYQFSAWGYHGNDVDVAALAAAGQARVRAIGRYLKWLRPRVYVPFASFVRFCHPRNMYLNRWRVTLDRVVEEVPLDHTTLRLLRPGDIVHADGTSEVAEPDAALGYWRNLFGTPSAPRAQTRVNRDELRKIATRCVTRIAAAWPRMAVPGRVAVHLEDIGQYAVLDCREGQFDLQDHTDARQIARLDAQSLLTMLRFPWGADTIQGASTATVLDRFRWYWLVYVRHADYKLAHLGQWRKLMPLPLAMMHGMRGRGG